MNFIGMCKDFNSMIWKPTWEWLKKYWKEYGLITIILGVGAGLYISWGLLRSITEFNYRKKK